MSKKGPMVLNIRIEGESAEELFAAGPIDIRDYFLKKLFVKPEDVRTITFHQVKDLEQNKLVRDRIVHKDNFWPGKEDNDNE